MTVEAVILAAGRSSRFEGNKLFSEIGGKKLIEIVIDSALQSSLDRIIVVASEDTAQGLKTSQKIETVINRNQKFGMGYSIKIGVSVLSGEAESVMILLGDMPGVDSDLIDRFIALSQNYPGKIIASKFRDKVMSPAIFPARYFGALSELRGDMGARQLLRNSSDLVTLDLDEEEFKDIDTKE